MYVWPMKNKILFLVLASLFSFRAMAECRPMIKQDLTRRVIQDGKLVKAGKIATGVTFVTVGGFWGTMGVIMLGPLWAGAVVGATFGAAVAAPVGATFVIIHKVKKDRIKNLGRTLSIISEGEELDLLHQRLVVKFPELERDQLVAEIAQLNASSAVCNGTISRFDREHRSKRRLIATPKDLERYLTAKFDEMYSTTSEALPSNLM